MRFYRTLPGGSTLDITSFLMNRSLVSRMLILGLPLLAVVLLLIFVATGSSIENIVNRAIARNAQLQAQGMRLALEHALAETRNQLLILAAGSMEPADMKSRLEFRARANGLHYREVAYVGLAPENRYLLLNHEGQVINVPMHVALDSPSSPFHNLSGEQQPGYVNVGQPMEAVYSMVPVNKSLQSLSLHVLRFFTAVQDREGNFKGYLLLSLDMKDLRDIVSRYSSPEAPIAASGAETRVRSLFFDRDGWMLFQSETPDAALAGKSLANDAVRAGFWGDYGRPGFSMAFRPSPEHINYWSMVADVQAGQASQLPMTESSTVWSNGQMRVERVSYVPISFTPGSGGAPIVLGGLAVLDTSFTTTRTGMQVMGTYAVSFLGGMLLLTLSLWWLARQMSKSLNTLGWALHKSNITGVSDDLDLPPLPRELEGVKTDINALLGRLRQARIQRLSHEALQDAQWQREPTPDLPHPEDLPASGLVGTSPAMQILYDQVRKASQVLADVLVIGETGTGKELVSEAIHRLSSRASGPFITINCGALDENLLMDTLFGHVKGAFTEARQARKGAFLAAEGGTLMLDEVGNAAPKVQQALLRALSTRRIRPLGSDQEVPFDTRIIAATNASLLEDAREGSFREDLYYRLAVITIHTPPLRERKSDIPELTVYFLTEAVKARAKAEEMDTANDADAESNDSLPATPSRMTKGARMAQAAQMPQLSRGALAKLVAYSWPGNVRELKNTLTRALTFCEENILYAENIQLGSMTLSNGGKTADVHGKQTAAHMADPQMQDGRDGLQGRIDDGAESDGNGAATRGDPQSSNGTAAMAPADATENQTTGQTFSSMSGSAAPISGFTASASPPRQTPQYAPGFERAPGQESAFASASGMSANTAEAAGGMTNTAMARLNSRQTEMWPRLVAMGSISRQEYQQMLGKDISMRTAQYDLQLFVQMGLVRKEGRGPAQRYVVVGASLSEG
ncbi:sigma 54-interacting transcriptional regulator [Desulfovibrio sp. 86]|uniref:Sigma 54 interacting domain protein n=1 Tax=uncultured Desulfovibrio sp. TaxID=167968 RepID=A0A212L9G7_9BACT|nr:sigma 54-interacting transcriptional regulator [Desulfovibrio sp. 86]SCM74213.1 Sigma 54 interacting domain protein [uncultured Desulfovibrio sp.]VZH34698.1 Sigma 54 interacting domain protein [Desulfovibrio sp. 86]